MDGVHEMVLGRLAAVTSALRVRGEEETRYEQHNGDVRALLARVDRVMEQLEQSAARLEEILA